MIDPLEPRRLFATTGLDSTYGARGLASVPVAPPVEGLPGGGGLSAAKSRVTASAFTPTGAAYVVVNQPTGRRDGNDALTQDSLFRLTAAGTLDTSFGDNGRIVVGRTYAAPFTATVAVSREGRVFVHDLGPDIPAPQLFAANGRPLVGANKRLRSYQNGLQPRGIKAAIFDDAGRLYLSGDFATVGKRFLVYGVARYASDGTLDRAWATKGFAAGARNTDGTIENPALSYAPSQMALSADEHLVATFRYGGIYDLDPEGIDFATYEQADALLLAPDGSRVGLTDIADSEARNSGSAQAISYDLRALADGTFVAATDGLTDLLGPVAARLSPDGSSKLIQITDGYAPHTILATPAGTFLTNPSVTDTDYQPYFPAIGRSDDTSFLNSYSGIAVLKDGRLMDAVVVNDDAGSRLVVRRFDGTGRYTPAASGKAAVRQSTRTLDVAGTGGGDVISIRYRAGRVNVRINNASAGTFSIRDFDTLTVHGEAGDDAIDIRMNGVPRAIRVLGGNGRDTLLADHPDATLDGGADNDSLRGPGYLDGGNGNDRLDGVGLLRGGAGDDVLLTHRRGVIVPAADD